MAPHGSSGVSLFVLVFLSSLFFHAPDPRSSVRAAKGERIAPEPEDHDAGGEMPSSALGRSAFMPAHCF